MQSYWSALHFAPTNLPVLYRGMPQASHGKTKVLTICGKRLSNRSPNNIVISVNGSQLENIQCAKLLGLEIDKELTFHLHVDKLYNYPSALEF